MDAAVEKTEDVRVPVTPGIIDEIEALVLAQGGEYQPKGEQISFLPLEHEFVPGMYIRTIRMPAGAIVTSRIHKTEHPYIVSEGACLVLVEGNEWRELRAPHRGITKPGTRRLLYILEDTVWTTYHPNPEDLRNLVEIETMLTVDYENPLLELDDEGSAE